MSPFLNEGHYALIWKTKRVKTGDVICFPDPENENQLLIKRIQATSDKAFFVIGDNLERSRDSRHFGWIDRNNVIGKLIMKV